MPTRVLYIHIDAEGNLTFRQSNCKPSTSKVLDFLESRHRTRLFYNQVYIPNSKKAISIDRARLQLIPDVKYRDFLRSGTTKITQLELQHNHPNKQRNKCCGVCRTHINPNTSGTVSTNVILVAE